MTEPEVEMCGCGCGATKEETVQKLMEIRGCDREEAEKAYVESEQEMASMSPDEIEMLKLLSFLIDSQER